MPQGLGLGLGYGAGAGADALTDLLARRFFEMMQQQRFEEEQRQFNTRHALDVEEVGNRKTDSDRRYVIEKGRLRVDQDTLGLRGKEFTQKVREYEEGAPDRELGRAHAKAEIRILNQTDPKRRLLDEKELINLRHVNELKEIAAQGAHVRPLAPIVIQTEAGPQLLDRNSRQVAPITDRHGNVITPNPTADMRNRASVRETASRSVDAVNALSRRLITKRGVAQRAAAAGRSIDSVLGNDPEYRTYQDARFALAGNLAVLQQGSRPSDADIKAIWLPLVPSVFSDTDESAKMKWDLIYTASGLKAPDARGAGAKSGADSLGIRR